LGQRAVGVEELLRLQLRLQDCRSEILRCHDSIRCARSNMHRITDKTAVLTAKIKNVAIP
jgi:hypothetical protein